jgi:hypothetical protein
MFIDARLPLAGCAPEERNVPKDEFKIAMIRYAGSEENLFEFAGL